MTRQFWIMWSAAAVSALGDGLRYVAFPLLAAGVSADPRALAVVFVAGYLPWPLCGLLAGALVDRTDRRALMWRTDSVRAVLMGIFAVAVAVYGADIALLAGTSFLIAVAETVFDNAASALVPQLVTPNLLEGANSRLLIIQTLNATLIGAPLAAVLYAIAHDVPIAVDAATFALSAMVIWLLPGRYRPDRTADRPGLIGDIAIGLRFLFNHRLLRTGCVLLIVLNATLAAGESVLVLYSRRVLGLTNVGYALLLIALAAGGIMGSVIVGPLRRVLNIVPIMIAACLGQACALLAAGLSSTALITLVAVFFVGVASACWSVVTVSYRQSAVPAELLGRVTSSYRVVAFSAMPIGAGLGGIVGHAYGLHAPYLIGGIALLLAVAVAAPGLRGAV